MTDNILLVRSPHLEAFAIKFKFLYENDKEETPLKCHMFPLKYAGEFKGIPTYMFDMEEMFKTTQRVGTRGTDETHMDGKSHRLDNFSYDNELSKDLKTKE